jgi:hypothetical protein
MKCKKRLISSFLKYSLFVLVVFALCSSAKAEDFANFYFHSINIQSYPTIKVTGLVENEYEMEWIQEFLNSDFGFEENFKKVENFNLDIIHSGDPYIIFEITYKSSLPKNADRTFSVNEYCDNRIYIFKKSQTLFVPEESKNKEPLGFINSASAYIETYLNSDFVVRYVLSEEGAEIKEQPNDESKTIAKLNYGDKVSISKDTFGYTNCVKDIYPNLLCGYWRKIRCNNTDGYVPDTYLAFMPANKHHSSLESFLTDTYGVPKPLGVDEEGNSLVIFGDYIVFSEFQLTNGFVYFNGISEQEFLIVAKELCYNKNMHRIEKAVDFSNIIEFRDMFDFIEYKLSGKYTIRWKYNTDQEIKRILSSVPDFNNEKPVCSSEFISANKNQSVEVPYSIWIKLLQRGKRF